MAEGPYFNYMDPNRLHERRIKELEERCERLEEWVEEFRKMASAPPFLDETTEWLKNRAKLRK